MTHDELVGLVYSPISVELKWHEPLDIPEIVDLQPLLLAVQNNCVVKGYLTRNDGSYEWRSPEHEVLDVDAKYYAFMPEHPGRLEGE